MASVVQYVDSIAASPVVRLDLNSAASGLMVGVDGIDFSPPPLRRALASSMLVDGEDVTASAAGNRTLKLPIQVLTSSATLAATVLASLARELSRGRNVLRVQLDGMTAPVFFPTFAAPDYTLSMLRLLASANTRVTLEIPAEPYGLGLPVVLGATASPENANPYFETNVANWSGTFGTPTRSTAQAHEGTASMLITPTGAGNTHVDSEQIGDGSSIAGRGFRATAWLYSPGGYATGVGPRINFYDAGMGYLTTAGATAAIGTAAWTFYDTGVLYAPLNAVYRQIIISYAGTPTAGQTLHADEAKISATGDFQVTNDPAAAVNGSYFDVSGVLGDVDTPAKFELSGGGTNAAPILAVRRHGTPSNITALVQAESMTQGTDTTTGADALMSNSTRSRCTFGTNAGMATRLTGSFPSTGGTPYTDRRGTYRMFLMLASSASSTTFAVRMKVDSQYGAATLLTGDTVTYVATDTSRRLVDLGLLQVPLGADPVRDGYGPEKETSSVSVQIQAQRVSGAGSLDLDYVAAAYADTELSRYGTVYTTSSTYDLVLDGVSGQVWIPYAGAVGEVHSYAAPFVAKDGMIPWLTPGQVNRIMLLRPDGVGTGFIRGPDTKTRTTTVRVTYWPRWLGFAP